MLKILTKNFANIVAMKNGTNYTKHMLQKREQKQMNNVVYSLPFLQFLKGQNYIIKIFIKRNFEIQIQQLEKHYIALFLEGQWFRENQDMKNIFKIFFIESLQSQNFK